MIIHVVGSMALSQDRKHQIITKIIKGYFEKGEAERYASYEQNAGNIIVEGVVCKQTLTVMRCTVDTNRRPDEVFVVWENAVAKDGGSGYSDAPGGTWRVLGVHINEDQAVKQFNEITKGGQFIKRMEPISGRNMEVETRIARVSVE